MNYNTLRNKPTINHKELIGNNKASDIGGMTEEDMEQLLTTDLTPYYTKDQIEDLFSRSFVYREKSGSIVTFDCPSTSQSIPEVTVGIEATQDLHGYDSPWVGGAGKNKLQVTGTTQTINGVTFTVNDNGSIIVNGTATADARFVIGEYILKAGSSVRLNGSPVDGSNSTIALGYQGYGIVSTANSDRVCDRTSASTDWDNDVYIVVTSGYTANNLTFKPMIRLASVTDATFAPYENICPISGWSAVDVYDGPTTDPQDATVYTTALKDANDQPLTCYGGQLENVNGVQTLTVTHANIASYNGETINEPWISSMDVYSEGATPTTGAQVVYSLATPTEIPQQSQAISTQDGTNNLWADTGDIEVKCLDRIIPAGE